MPRDSHHPAWNVYDSLRTSRLNVLYYSGLLEKTEKLQLFMQVVLAATVPSSAIAGFEIWDFWLGKHAWEFLVALSSIIAFSQPFLGLTKKIKIYSELVDGYKILYYDLQYIKEKIESDKSYEVSHQKLFKAAKDRKKKLDVKETGISINKKLQLTCEYQVKKEHPSSKFYIPT